MATADDGAGAEARGAETGGAETGAAETGGAEAREELAGRVLAALEAARTGSRAGLRGSLAAGTADEFSDIDVEWVVPDVVFPAAVADVRRVLEGVRPVEELRVDPDHLHSACRRLLFARFVGVPLFWRLDLSVRAESATGEPDRDAGNPETRAREGEWSRPASALANAVGALKAVARGRHEDARGLLDRGFARIGEQDAATGAWPADVVRLARAAVLRDGTLAVQAERVAALAREPRFAGRPD